MEEQDEKMLASRRQTFAPVALVSKAISPAQPKMFIYCNEFLAIYHALFDFSHILWEATVPTLVMADNKSVTRFFRTKAIPPPTPWNAGD